MKILKIIAAAATLAALAVVWQARARAPEALRRDLSKGFSGLAAVAVDPQATAEASYRLAEAPSEFSGKRPLKQIIRLKNGAAEARDIPLRLTQRIAATSIRHAGRELELPGQGAALELEGEPRLYFEVPGHVGRYDWSDVSGLEYSMRAWREGEEGVLELTLSKRVEAGAEELIDPTFDLADTTNTNRRFDGAGNSHYLGNAMASGDFNGDGVKDLLMSSKYSNASGKADSGSAYVVLGGGAHFPAGSSAANVSLTANFNVRYDGAAQGDLLGWSAAAADLNNDGVDDVILGANLATPTAKNTAGSVYVILGGSLTFTAATGVVRDLSNAAFFNVRYDGATAGDQLGSAVGSGKFNGDSAAELLMGAIWADTLGRTDNGAGYMIYGGAAAFPSTLGLVRDLSVSTNFNMRFDGSLPNGNLGVRFAAGDLNDDGTPDFIIAADRLDIPAAASGAVYVIYGGVTFTAGTGLNRDFNPGLAAAQYNVRFIAGNVNDHLGAALATGDLNSDGKADLIMGEDGADLLARTDNGAVNIVYGGALTFSAGVGTQLPITACANVRIAGAVSSDFLGGAALAVALNADAMPDLAVGAYSAQTLGRTLNGAAWILYGGPGRFKPGLLNVIDLLGAAGYDIRYDGPSSLQNLGYSFSSADWNNDGLPDLAINCANGDTPPLGNNGTVHVFYGGGSQLPQATLTPTPCALDLSSNSALTAGLYSYCSIRIRSGVTLSISGAVTLTVSGDFIMEPGSIISGSGQGFAGGAPGAAGLGPGGGLAGGGNPGPGNGGSHVSLGGGGTGSNDSASAPMNMGSGGGGGASGGGGTGSGGAGGAYLQVNAPLGSAVLDGTIQVNAGLGTAGGARGGGGGGSGGAIYVRAQTISGSGPLNAAGSQGMSGAAQGNGGAGGVINLCQNAGGVFAYSGATDVTGGLGGIVGANGQVYNCTGTSLPAPSTKTQTPVLTATQTLTPSPTQSPAATPACTFASGEAADFALGQANLTASGADGGGTVNAAGLENATDITSAGGKLFVADGLNSRILIWNTLPYGFAVPADVVVGQTSMTQETASVAQNRLASPFGVFSDGTRLIVADTQNSRVLIWSPVPTTNGVNANIVLGQANFTAGSPNRGGSCAANTMSSPRSCWFDGSRLYVSDSGNHRVLVFNGIPSYSGVDADLVIGQSNFTNNGSSGGSQGLNTPAGLYVKGTRLYVADANNNRVLVYSPLPTVTQAAASRVFGQSSLSGVLSNRGGSVAANTLWFPYRVQVDSSDRVFIADNGNHRVLGFNGLPSADGVNADFVLGQPNLSSNSLVAANAFSLNAPLSAHLVNNRLYACDTYNRIMIYDCGAVIPTATPSFTSSPNLSPTPSATRSATPSPSPTPNTCYPATFGDTNAYGSNANTPNAIECNQFSLSQSGNLQSISVNVGFLNSAGLSFSVAIYSDSGSNPATRLAYSGPISITATGLHTVPMANIALGAGTYFLCFNTESGLRVTYNNGGGVERWTNYAFGSGWPDPFGGSTSGSAAYSIYATVCSDATPTFTVTPACGSPLTFGDTTAYGSNANTPNAMECNQFTLSQAGLVTGLMLNIGFLQSPGLKVKGAMYGDSAGNPGTRLAFSADTPVSATGWLALPFSTPYSAAPGTYYLCYNTESSGVRATYNNGGGIERWNNYAFSSAWPDPFGTVSSGNAAYSIYALYCPAATPTVTPSNTASPQATATPTRTMTPCGLDVVSTVNLSPGLHSYCYVHVWPGGVLNVGNASPSALGVTITVTGDFIVDSGGLVSALARGFTGGLGLGGNGPGPGGLGTTNAKGGGGGGHGGSGGAGQGGGAGPGGAAYDTPAAPSLCGSGAGAGNDFNSLGGNGGGALLVYAPSGSFLLHGTVNASGASGYCSPVCSAGVGSSRVDLQACKLEYSIVSPK